MKELLIRSVSGLVYVTVLAAAALGGSQWIALLLLFFLLTGSFELLRLTNRDMPALYRNIVTGLMTLLFSFVTVIVACEENNISSILALFVLLLVFAIILIFLILRNLSMNDVSFASLLGGTGSILTYLIFPFICMILLTEVTSDYGLPTILILFIIVWANDTFAYLVGTAIGKHKMLEKISPKKSWEGFSGGIILTIILLYSLMKLDIITWSPALLTASVFAIGAGTLGDLLESKLKRDAGVKDSGKLIPGHGGILDRIDSLLLAAPIFLLCIIIIEFIEFPYL